MEPWYKVVVPRKEVREGRSFNPDDFAIALEQVGQCECPEAAAAAEQEVAAVGEVFDVRLSGEVGGMRRHG